MTSGKRRPELPRRREVPRKLQRPGTRLPEMQDKRILRFQALFHRRFRLRNADSSIPSPSRRRFLNILQTQQTMHHPRYPSQHLQCQKPRHQYDHALHLSKKLDLATTAAVRASLLSLTRQHTLAQEASVKNASRVSVRAQQCLQGNLCRHRACHHTEPRRSKVLRLACNSLRDLDTTLLQGSQTACLKTQCSLRDCDRLQA